MLLLGINNYQNQAKIRKEIILPQNPVLEYTRETEASRVDNFLIDDPSADYTFVTQLEGTFRDQNGDIQSAVAAQPRIDYHPVTGQRLGILKEGEVTNLHGYSEDANQHARSNCFVSGTLNGGQIITASGQEPGTRNFKRADVDLVEGKDYVSRFECEPDTWSKLMLVARTGVSEKDYYMTFDMTGDGVIGQIHPDVREATLEKTPDGKFIATLKFTAPTGSQLGQWTCMPVFIEDINGSTAWFQNSSIYVNGVSGTPKSFIFHRLDVQQATEPGSYVPTTTADPVTKGPDTVQNNDIENHPYFNNAQGAFGVRVRHGNVTPDSNAYLFHLAEGFDALDHYSMFLLGPNYGRARYDTRKNTGSAQQQNMGQGGVSGKESFYGVIWDENDITFVADGDFVTIEGAGGVQNINQLYIGHLYTAHMYGHIQKCVYFDQKPSVRDFCSYMYESKDYIIAGGGQSLMAGYGSNSNTGNDNLGERAMFKTAQKILGPSFNPQILILAENGAAINGDSVGDPNGNFYIDPDQNDAFGRAFNNWQEPIIGARIAGVTVQGLLHAQGQSDTTDPIETFERDTKRVLELQREIANTSIIVLEGPGRKKTADAFDSLRVSYRNIEREDNDIYLAPALIQFPANGNGGDNTHRIGAENEITGPRLINKFFAAKGFTITDPVDGPRAETFTRNGTAVTIPIIAGDGSDIAPSSGIEGFRAFNYDTGTQTQGSEIPITVVRTDPNTLTGTLDSAPTDGLLLYYGYNAMHDITDTANLVVDDNGIPMDTFKLLDGVNVPV